MEKAIAGIMKALKRVAAIMAILIVIGYGMIGVYRFTKLSWLWHFVLWVAFTIALDLITDDPDITIGLTFSMLAGFSLVSNGLVYVYRRFNVFERINEESTFDDYEEEEEAREFAFGIFSSALMILCILIGAITSDGEESLGHVVASIGICTPVLGALYRGSVAVMKS